MFQTHLPFIGINLVLQDEFVQQVCTASSISHQPFKFLLSKTVFMCQYRNGHNPHIKSKLFAHIKTRTGCRLESTDAATGVLHPHPTRPDMGAVGDTAACMSEIFFFHFQIHTKNAPNRVKLDHIGWPKPTDLGQNQL